MQTIFSYSTLPNTSALVRDFAEGSSFFHSRFPLNPGLFSSEELLLKHAQGFSGRVQALNLITNSMKSSEPSAGQKENLEILRRKNSLVVVSGQQIGFLGGPLYTVLKIAGALSLAEKLSRSYTKIRVVPVFWLEDNDHDAQEAAEVYLHDARYALHCMQAPSDLPFTEKYSTGEISFPGSIEDVLTKIAAILPASPYKADLLAWLKEVYAPGRSWSDAFYDFINGCFAGSGLLIMRASEARRMGLFAPLLREEIAGPGKTREAVDRGVKALTDQGYHRQAEASDVNAFYHFRGQRLKIAYEDGIYSAGGKNFSREEMLELLESEAGNFSPNVILRPIIQDQILPNIAYVGGPGELAYLAELHEAYRRFDAWQPAFVLRHSASFLDFHAARFLGTRKHSPDFFMRKWENVEQEILPAILDPELEQMLDGVQNNLDKQLMDIRERSVRIDKTLSGAVEAKKAGMDKLFTRMRKKILAAQKRNSPEVYGRYRALANFLFPAENFQDRIFSPLLFFNLFGKEGFIEEVRRVTLLDEHRHYAVLPGGAGEDR